jgi:hypothetical protein
MRHPYIKRRSITKSTEMSPTNDQSSIKPNSPKTSQIRKPFLGKLNGNLQQFFEEYSSLAHEAIRQGDRVLAESYYQYAEHALRLSNQLQNSPDDF